MFRSVTGACRTCQQCKGHFSTGRASTPRVCIVGSGPGGFYVAQHLIKNNADVEVDIYERLPVPFGLVRYGVAPDHQEVKNVINTFTKTAHNPRVNFYGNVTLGRDVMLKDLETAYNAVVLTYGAGQDRELDVRGEKLKGVLSARRFVGWYNGLPEDSNLEVRLETDTAVVLGQGNVAVDVARILLTKIDDLKKTDITPHAVAALAVSRVRRVILVGRRGPLQVAFTIKELREMLKLPGVHTQFLPGQMNGVQQVVNQLNRPRKRLTELLLQAAATPQPEASNKSLQLMFLRSPLSFSGDTQVSAVELSVNALEGDKLEDQRAKATGQKVTVDCGLVLRSIGYLSVPVDPDIPFDPTRGIVLQRPGLYAAGWVATGPVGVILSTMTNAFETANTLLRDMASGAVDTTSHKPGAAHILSLLNNKGVPTVDFAGWERIDRVEVERGIAAGKPREKIINTLDMLEIGAAVK